MRKQVLSKQEMKMDGVTYSKFSPHDCTLELLERVIACYQDVFAGPPWYETWEYDQVRSDLRHEIGPQSSCWIARDGANVLGFCWGYPISVADLERKLGVSLDADGDITRRYGTCIAYQDELGVVQRARGRKIAKSLFAIRHRDFVRAGLRYGIVRTREYPEPSVTYLWFTSKLGYKVLARYPGDDGRVVLGRSLAGLDAHI